MMTPITPVLRVMDIETSLAFYTQALGFEGGGFPDSDGCLTYGEAYLGEARLAFMRAEKCNRFAPGDCGIDLYISLPDEADIVALRRRMAARVPNVSELREGLWGDRAFSLTDLDGHRLLFAQARRYHEATFAETHPAKAVGRTA